jgi:predicted transcriptional regulator
MARPIPTSMRLDPDLKAALERAAKHDGRSASSMLDRILRAWLVEKGFLKVPQE